MTDGGPTTTRMKHQLRAVGLDFVEHAPLRFVFGTDVGAPPAEVFAAISADPSTWTAWFPGFRDGGYEGPTPYGVGTRRWVRVGRGGYYETMMAWDAPNRWTYRVDESDARVANALVEEWTISRQPGGGSLVTWTFAVDPSPVLRLTGPLGSVVIGSLFRRAMRNLDRRIRSPTTPS